jgi:cyclopropane-fatty-acyl-phospholipid synthase
MLNQLMIRQVRQRIQGCGLPVAVELWTGELVMPPSMPDYSPRVLVRLRNPASLKALVKPSLGTLARAYVEGELDLDGDIRDILSVGDSFCNAEDGKPGMAANPRTWWWQKKPMPVKISSITMTCPMRFMPYGWMRDVSIRVLISRMQT